MIKYAVSLQCPVDLASIRSLSNPIVNGHIHAGYLCHAEVRQIHPCGNASVIQYSFLENGPLLAQLYPANCYILGKHHPLHHFRNLHSTRTFFLPQSLFLPHPPVLLNPWQEAFLPDSLLLSRSKAIPTWSQIPPASICTAVPVSTGTATSFLVPVTYKTQVRALRSTSLFNAAETLDSAFFGGSELFKT